MNTAPTAVLDRALEFAPYPQKGALRMVAALAQLEGAIRAGDEHRAGQAAGQLASVVENIYGHQGSEKAQYVRDGRDGEDEGDEAA